MQITLALHGAVQQYPDRTATVFGDRVRTYGQSCQRIARLAGALRGMGVGEGDRIGILALNSDRYHEYLLAVPWAGAVVVPLNIRWTPAEITYALRESGTRVLLVDDAFAAMAADLQAECDSLTELIFCGDGQRPQELLDYEQLVAGSEPIEDTRRRDGELFGLFYTGGTTGVPKGVMLSHRNVLSSTTSLIATADGVTREGRLMHAAPLFHLADLAAWSTGLLLGSTHVFVPSFTPAGVAQAIERYEVTDLLLIPTMIQMLVDSPEAVETNLASVRRLLYGGSSISEAVLERARTKFPAAGFIQVYGMTELAPIGTMLTPHEHADPVLRRGAGRAAVNVELRVVDTEGQEVPRGTVGEVVVRGDNVMLGYWNRPEDTAAAIRDGWLRTGDGGYMDDNGYLFIADRIKDVIITGGENVYSAEVENTLAKHAGVAICAVIGIPDPTWGEKVHAVVLRQPGSEVTASELTDFCRQYIANYKVPRSVSFVDALPTSAAGKIVKRELRRLSWDDAENE
jgi:acyl-CoA synthetase (AMP-forming)/AMP-acid ligase II